MVVVILVVAVMLAMGVVGVDVHDGWVVQVLLQVALVFLLVRVV